MFVDKLICNSIINALQLERTAERDEWKDGKYDIREDGDYWVFKPENNSNIISIEIKDDPLQDKRGYAYPSPRKHIKITAKSLTPEQVQGLNDIFDTCIHLQTENEQIIIRRILMIG